MYGSTVPGNDPRGVFGRENLLREKIGLRQTDARMIRPTEVPSEVAVEWDWEQVLAEALRNDASIRNLTSKIAQLEAELTAAQKDLLPASNFRSKDEANDTVTANSATMPPADTDAAER